MPSRNHGGSVSESTVARLALSSLVPPAQIASPLHSVRLSSLQASHAPVIPQLSVVPAGVQSDVQSPALVTLSSSSHVSSAAVLPSASTFGSTTSLSSLPSSASSSAAVACSAAASFASSATPSSAAAVSSSSSSAAGASAALPSTSSSSSPSAAGGAPYLSLSPLNNNAPSYTAAPYFVLSPLPSSTQQPVATPFPISAPSPAHSVPTILALPYSPPTQAESASALDADPMRRVAPYLSALGKRKSASPLQVQRDVLAAPLVRVRCAPSDGVTLGTGAVAQPLGRPTFSFSSEE
jgi:hypothetical protein